MDKDQYAMMQMRQTIVGKYLDKLEKVESKDIELIPALIEFIEKGNKERFEKYRQFCEEYELQEKEERLEKYKKNLGYYEEVYRKQYEKLKEMRLLISQINDDYNDYVPTGTFNALFKFLEKNEISMGKQIYVLVDGKIHKVTSVREADKKIVLSTEDHSNDYRETKYLPKLPDGIPSSENYNGFSDFF